MGVGENDGSNTMHKKLRMALVTALLVAGAWGGTAAATAHDNCEQNGNNASGCDFDGDGISNKADDDDDEDGILDEDEAEGCGRNGDTACGAEEPGGEQPAPELPVDPADVLAQVEAAIGEIVGQLPVPGEEEPPAEEPPSEDPDPAAEVESLVNEVVGQLPEPPADPAGELQAVVEGIVGQIPAPPAP